MGGASSTRRGAGTCRFPTTSTRSNAAPAHSSQNEAASAVNMGVVAIQQPDERSGDPGVDRDHEYQAALRPQLVADAGAHDVQGGNVLEDVQGGDQVERLVEGDGRRRAPRRGGARGTSPRAADGVLAHVGAVQPARPGSSAARNLPNAQPRSSTRGRAQPASSAPACRGSRRACAAGSGARSRDSRSRSSSGSNEAGGRALIVPQPSAGEQQASVFGDRAPDVHLAPAPLRS